MIEKKSGIFEEKSIKNIALTTKKNSKITGKIPIIF